MNIKQLEKSQKMYLEVKSLDAEIIEIEKIAILVVDGNAEVNLSLKVKDTTPKPKESDKAKFEEDGSQRSTPSIGMGFDVRDPWSSLFPKYFSDSVKNHTVSEQGCSVLRSELSDNLSLNVLAILLDDKLRKREKLIKSLNRIGVTL